jgi:hypothetical protein
MAIVTNDDQLEFDLGEDEKATNVTFSPPEDSGETQNAAPDPAPARQ